jgi:peptide/nickel transport system substrate-binding protein
LERTRGITVDRLYPVASIVIMRFNQLHPPFDNPKLRRALLYAVDQREYMSAVGGNEKYWRPCLSFYPCDTAMASEVGAEPLKGPRDLELAKRLIKESGYQGEKIVLLAPTDFPVVNAISLVTEDLLRRIGLNVELAASDWGTLISRRASKEAADKGGWNIFLTILGGADNLDPAESNSLRGNGADAWFGWPTDPIVERLRDDWIDAPDEAERKQIAADVQRQLFHSVPHIPIGDYFVTTAFRENLEGVNLGPSLYMWNVVKR